ncbi:outer membrane lipoprotein [compost metagenome]
MSIGVRSNDSWITSKVRADMLAAKDFDSTKVKVVTENSEVFLIGLVTRKEGDQAVEIARHVSGVKQVIKAFEFAQN